MSWLGGSLSSLTGQLSNLTKDILTEGTEEVSDHVTELRLAQERLKELDTVCVSQKVEIDRLKLLVREWEEKAETSELQINSISREYRTLLEEKESEIKTLKQQQHEHLELKRSYVEVDSEGPATIGFSNDGFESVGLAGDEHDFGDNIAMQHDINRLRGNLQKLQVECEHWKKVAEQNSGKSENQVQGPTEGFEQQLKALQQQLDYEKDQRQFEISSLQDAHNHKVSTIRKKHREEVAELKQKVQDLEWSSEGWDTQESSESTNLKLQIGTLQDELSALKVEREEHVQTITKLNETLEEQKSALSIKHAQNLHLDNQLKVAKEKIDGLLIDHDQADTLEVLGDLRQIRQHLDTSEIGRRHKLLVEKDIIVNEIISSGQQGKELAVEIEALEEERDKLKEDASKMLTDLGDKEHQKITGDIIDSLEKENLLLKKRNLSLQEQVTLLEKAVQNATRERSLSLQSDKQSMSVDSGKPPMESEATSDTTSTTSDLSELSRRNLELDEQVTLLREQIRKYETEIEQFELLQTDWQNEKDALEQVLMQLRDQLREKENSLNIAEAQKEQLKQEIVDLKMGRQEEIATDPDPVTANWNRLLKDKEEELKAIMSEKEDLENNLKEVPELKLQLEQKHKEVESLLNSKDEKAEEIVVTLEKEVENLKEKIRGKNEEIINLSLEKEETMSSLEELDNQHQEEMSHIIKIKDQLSKSNEELQNKLTTSENEVQSLRSENEALRSQQMVFQTDESASSNELNHQIADLKENNQQLQQLLDKHSKQIAQLQKDLELKEENLKEVKSKLVSSAEALNDLHMDKQELTEKVKKLKDDKSELSKKLKQAREKESELLKESSSDSNNRNADCINRLQNENCELAEKCSKLSETVDDQTAELNKINSNLRSKDNDLEKVNTENKAEIDRLNTAIEESKSMVHGLENELTSVKTDCDRLSEECKRKHEECESFSRQLHALENELHASKSTCKEVETENTALTSQVEMLNNELTIVKQNISGTAEEYETLNKEMKKVKALLEEVTDKLHNRTEECNQFAEEIEAYKAKLAEVQDKQANHINAELLSATGELVLVKEDLANKTEESERMYQDIIGRDEEIASLKSTIENIKKENNEVLVKMEETKIANEKQLSEKYSAELKNLETERDDLLSQYSMLKSQLEKAELLEEPDSYEKSALGQEQGLDVQDSPQNDIPSVALENLQETVSKLQQEKIIAENELMVSKAEVQKTVLDSKAEKDTLNKKIQELESVIQTLKSEEQVTRNDYNILNMENGKLRQQIVKLEAEVERYKQVVISFEEDLSELNQEKDSLLSSLQESNEKFNTQETTVEKLQQKSVHKDNEIGSLQRKLNLAKSVMNETQLQTVENDSGNKIILTKDLQDDNSTELVEVQETIQPVKKFGGLGMERLPSFEEKESDKRDIVIEIERLQDQLKDKDKIISEMQRNSASLLKMLDSKPKSAQGESSQLERHKLENEIRSMKMEKEQMMDVLTEKSRENSNLKAEVQRLINVVAAERSALDKLQKDNQELVRNSPERDGQRLDDMQKQAVQNLSRIIRDKDLEIESLTQKNVTLLSVLQESSNEGTEIKSLLQDKENLTKQLAALQGEREQMITYLNQKHQESLAYHSEVQRLTAVVQTEMENNQKLKMEYESLVPQFEEKKQVLLKCQSELIEYKQKYTDLEVKYGQLFHQSDSGESVDKTLFDSKVKEIVTLQTRIDELMENIKEKEAKIQVLHQNFSELEQNFRSVDNEKAAYKKQVDNNVFQLHGLQSESSDLKAEIAQLQQQKQTVISECQTLTEMNKKLTLQLQDSEFEVKSLQEKTSSLTAIIQEEKGEKVRVERLTQENEVTENRIRQLQQERDQSVMALQQTQQHNLQLQQEVQTLKEKETKLNKELERLRQHLIQIEDGYTREALAAEEREKELRTRLTDAEEQAFTSSSAMETTSQQASQKMVSLQQQLEFVSQQRDQAYLQISTLQEQNQTYAVSLANLQMVLEQFQQEKDQLVADETEKYSKEIKLLKSQVKDLESNLNYTKEQLEEASDGLEAASRLSEQLDKKEEAIDALKEEVQIRESSLKTVEDELKSLKSKNDDRVEKLVIKNLFLGYFTTPVKKRKEVLRAIGGVLLFTQDDFNKVDDVEFGGGWMSGLLKFGGSTPTTPPTTPTRRSTVGTPVSRGNSSFSEMFVRFLERESSPPPPTVRLPAEEMVRDVQKQKETQKQTYNPFTAPRHVAIPLQTSIASVSSSDHILMSSSMPASYSLTTFAAPSESSATPPGSGRNTPASTASGAILKDVLNR